MNVIDSVEDAYAALAQDVIAFINERPWDEAVGEYGVFAKMVSCEWGVRRNGILDQTGDCPPDEINRTACKAVLFLRDHELRTTGQRIWGLTYTLFPDGKFNIEYDYNKPDEYDLADEQEPPLGVAQALNNLAATGIAIEDSDATTSTPEQQFLAQALAQLQAQTASHSASWGLGSEAQWNLDMATGTLRFTFADGRVLNAPVQVIGTYNTKDGSFLWGWDHPSVPLSLRRAAQRVHDYGLAHGIERFTERSLECTQDQAWELTAAAAQLDGAAGAYRGDAKGTWVYMVFATPDAG
jgi:hypothetical protein